MTETNNVDTLMKSTQNDSGNDVLQVQEDDTVFIDRIAGRKYV